MAKSNNLNSKVSITETNTFVKGMNKDFHPSYEPNSLGLMQEMLPTTL